MPQVVPKPPARRPTPPVSKKNRAIFVDFNQSPYEIVRVMAEAQQQAQRFNSQRKRWRLLLWLLFPAGLPFLVLDLLMGYNFLTFSLVSFTLWLGAIVGLILLRRQGQTPDFGSRYDLVKTIFETLKDDVSPKKTLVGWLDLTGAEQPSKATLEKKSQSGQPIIYYRDEWLRLKTSLYDGNVLRLSLIDRIKARQGFYKRGRSGKLKWRAGTNQNMHQLHFSISVNPGAYQIQPLSGVVSIPNSRFAIEQALADEGRIDLKAACATGFDAWDVLSMMRFAYDHLHEAENGGGTARET